MKKFENSLPLTSTSVNIISSLFYKDVSKNTEYQPPHKKTKPEKPKSLTPLEKKNRWYTTYYLH